MIVQHFSLSSLGHLAEELLLLCFVVLTCTTQWAFSPSEQLLEFMHQLPAFANMTMSVRRELCAVMVFAVVERAGTIVLNDGEEVSRSYFGLSYYTRHLRFHRVKVLFWCLKIKKIIKK